MTCKGVCPISSIRRSVPIFPFPVHFIHHLVENGRLLAGGTAHPLASNMVTTANTTARANRTESNPVSSPVVVASAVAPAAWLEGMPPVPMNHLKLNLLFADNAQNDLDALGDGPHHSGNDQYFIIKDGMHIDSVNSCGRAKTLTLPRFYDNLHYNCEGRKKQGLSP